MSRSLSSFSNETTCPRRLTWRYQSSSSSTVSATRGSWRMNRSRSRLSSMFTRMRPGSQSYQVATVCGEPSRRSEAITAGFGRRRNSSTSAGTGGGGIGLKARLGGHRDVDPPFARAIELAEEDRLEVAEREFAVLEWDRHRRGGEDRADVRPRVAVALVDVLPVP